MSNAPRLNILFKYGATLMVSDELLFDSAALVDSRYERKVANTLRTPPTHAQMLDYGKALAAFNVLKASCWMDWGNPESEPGVVAPTDHITTIYAETHDEWLARCRAMREGS